MKKRGKVEPLSRCCECGQGVYYGEGEQTSVSASREVYDIFRGSMGRAQQELFRVLVMNARNRILHIEEVAIGNVNTVHVNPADCLRHAIIHGAASIIIVHNHPSGDPTPSPEDRTLTERIGQAGQIMGIKLLDHIIIAPCSYYSFADSGDVLKAAKIQGTWTQ